MVSTFFGLETARRALQSQQIGIDITGHNIANANTQGYTRQTVNMTATTPLTYNSLGNQIQLGTGVNVSQVSRARDIFLDRQFRNETSKGQYWDSRQKALAQVEAMLNEPSENSLREDLTQFWNAWSDLSKDPDSLAARTVVKEKAINLTDSFHDFSNKINDIQRSVNADICGQIKQINNIAKQIAELNKQITGLEGTGGSPNDLYDKRDALIDELSKFVNVKAVETQDPSSNAKTFALIIGDPNATPQQTLINGGQVNLLKEYSVSEVDNGQLATISWENGSGGTPDKWGNTIQLGSSGSLIASIEVRGDKDGKGGYLADFMAQVDALATGVASAVNSLHTTGQDLDGVKGENFFVAQSGSINATNIQLNANIDSDIRKIAAAAISSEKNPGDGSIALALSSLAEGWDALNNSDKPVAASSFGAFYAAVVAKVGTDVQQAEHMQNVQTSTITQVANSRESVSGVSLDEEMMNLVKYQKSYSAAARVVTVMDDLLETLIKGMGVTR